MKSSRTVSVKVLIKNEFLKKHNIFLFKVALSPENNWSCKEDSEWFYFKEAKDINVYFSIKFKRFKIILDAYTSTSCHINLIDKKIRNNDNLIKINFQDFYSINFTELKKIRGCSCLWHSPVIRADGSMTVCCNDNNFELALGNINENDFNKIWFEDEKIKKYRYFHLNGDYWRMPLCALCINIKSIPLCNELVKEYSPGDFQLKGIQKFYKSRIENKKIISNLLIEPTDKCNLNCFFCNQKYDDWQKVHGCKKGFMNYNKFVEFFKKYISRDYFFKNISLFWLGEPLMHPEINKFFSFFKKTNKYFQSLEIHTNASLINDEFIEFLEKADFYLKIHYSVDSADKDTYKTIKGKNLYDKVVSNIKKTIKKTENNHFIQHVIQFVVLKENYKSASLFKKKWQDFFEKEGVEYQITTFFDFKRKHIIYFRALDALNKKKQEEADSLFYNIRNNISHKGNDGFIDYNKDRVDFKINNYCFMPFEFITIRHDGVISHCCRATDMKDAEFNIFEKSPEQFEIYIKKFFQRFLNRTLASCRECVEGNSLNMHRIYVEDALYFMNSFNIDSCKLLESLNLEKD
ncbi:MAG: radical SAM protein [Candidatus Muiribacteriota bacterium]